MYCTLPCSINKYLARTQLQADRFLRILITVFASLLPLRLIIYIRATLIAHAPILAKENISTIT